MIRKITLFFSCILSVSAFAQQTGCTKFKNGTFKVTDPASKQTCIITRDGNTQTEKMEASDETYDFDIVWIDDCTYTVTPTPATAARNKEVLKAGTMTVRIIKAKDNSYTQRVTVATNPKFRRVDEVFLVESK
ncbi:hypothetical protein OGH69_07510 [Flavobacterium sp. MFBS3-15]|uniref:hypothetical protein n=1 Tax=Flavobacterium sp. MFBS3-15 TaxID=2989816 RepID=UPI002235B8D7|nr:hypothetical protein [Flavobacterium sp. MFBS3-15]MCW4468803.1 hypothetical protein [Flavobacterium sp. MFBS3-15]